MTNVDSTGSTRATPAQPGSRCRRGAVHSWSRGDGAAETRARAGAWFSPAPHRRTVASAVASTDPRRVIPVSVLLATYAGEIAAHVDEALASVFAQTVRPLEIILVLDGPVGAGQEAIIRQYEARSAEIPTVRVQLASNRGLANALNAGLGHCRGRYVCRMDSDDVCMPQRLERQWAVAELHPGIDCMGSWHLEFEGETSSCDRLKTMPERHDDIVRALKWRDVFSHPTMFVKTEALRRIGGYRDIKLLEDYDCLIRLIMTGQRLHAMQEPLLYYRRTPAQMKRRGGLSYFVRDVAFRFHHVRGGFFSPGQLVGYIPIALLWRLTPNSLRSLLYRLVRRRVSDFRS